MVNLYSPSFIGSTTEWCELECTAIILLLWIIIIIMIIINIIIIINNNYCHDYTTQHKLRNVDQRWTEVTIEQSQNHAAVTC